MVTDAVRNFEKVVKVAQEILLDEEDKSSITPELIKVTIERVLQLTPRWAADLDLDAVTDELVRRFSYWIGQDTTLKNDTDHVKWLNAGRKRDWRYWQRYREWLERRLSYKAVDALDKSTDKILGLLEDPLRDGSWSRRGLVVGHVQSGKTGNYTALINKAADSGYKIIIVLAGLHNNLRSQTQMRLDEGFLGFETRPNPEESIVVGVGEIDPDPAIRPDYATNRTEKGDFSTAATKNLGIRPEQRPCLLVVKKNKTVLERLYRWLQRHVALTTDSSTGRKVVTHLPLLLIDDEADHASVDTGEQTFDQDGKPDEDHQPTAINSRIRKILHTFTRSAYVGYTATPFANIFIHERGATADEGVDLFPSAFIINLAAPSNYIGPAKVFGRLTPEGREGGLSVTRHVSDHMSEDGRSGWMPRGHRNGYEPSHPGPDGLPESLVQAIDSFFLACVVRHLRGQGAEHSSMLIHVTRFNSVQAAVREQVHAHVSRCSQRLLRGIGHEAILARIKSLWDDDFLPTMDEIGEALEADVERRALIPAWNDIVAALPEVVADIDVRMINGTAKDALDYADQGAAGLKVIAVGGDKLARGLTLEGLCVSYFLRASKMYDTLMQMGRWFGYRPGYLDVCRLYTTEELTQWFRHITDAAEELRDEFEIMAANGATPREYGLRVQSHSVLMVTSRLKMRAARNLMLSFSGQLLETVSLFREPRVLESNLDALRSLVACIGAPIENPEYIRRGRKTKWQGFLWRDAKAADVVDFLTSYRTHPDALKVNSAMIAEFIQAMTLDNELTEWSVALIGAMDGDGDTHVLADGVSVRMLQRQASESSQDGVYSIGRLMSPRDESIDADEPTWEAALTLTKLAWKADPARIDKSVEPEAPSGIALRKIRGHGDASLGIAPAPHRGLLVIYLLDPRHAWTGLPPGAPPVVAFGISFPGSNSGRKVEYKVNNVGWELEYGSAE